MDKYIYFDESMDKFGNFNLIGGVSIPMNLFDSFDSSEKIYLNKYSSTSFYSILRKKKSKFSDNLKEKNYLDWLVNSLRIIGTSIKTNIILFPNLVDDIHSKGYKYLIYNKLPERLIYGFLKHDLKPMKSNVKVFVDSNDNYSRYRMEEYLFNHLNALAIYRNLNYHVSSVNILRKNKYRVMHEKKEEYLEALIDRIRNVFNDVKFRSSQKINTVNLKRQNELIINKLEKDFTKIDIYEDDIELTSHLFGISIIDAILGIVNTIYMFNYIYYNNGIGEDISMIIGRARFVYEFLENEHCNEIISDIRLFCLNKTEELHQSDFSDEIDLFKKGMERFYAKINRSLS